MKRPGRQRGSLRKRGNFWHGSFQVYAQGGGSRQKMLSLGRISEMTESEARAKLDSLVEAANSQIPATKLNDPIFTLVENLKTIPSPSSRYTKGWLGEALVAADLESRGCTVYRPMSAFAAHDLLVNVEGKYVRVEVKWVGNAIECQMHGRLTRNMGKFDLLALVFKDGRIVYKNHAELGFPGLLSDAAGGAA